MAPPFLSPLPQAKQREDEQNHDDQADKINQTIHGALPKLPLSPVATRKKTFFGEESSGGPHGGTGPPSKDQSSQDRPAGHSRAGGWGQTLGTSDPVDSVRVSKSEMPRYKNRDQPSRARKK
jgi:hypothetical protein